MLFHDLIKFEFHIACTILWF